MDDLIARLEVPTEVSREFDARIAVAIGLERLDLHGRKFLTVIADHGFRNFSDADLDSWRVPRYTSSLDAAMTLARDPQERLDLLSEAVKAVGKQHHIHIQFFRGDACKEVARQYCIAALKARQSRETPPPVSA